MVIVVTVPSATVSAALMAQYVQDLNFEAAGDVDEVMNHLDPDDEGNPSTWNPVPQGVYYGPWVKDSLQRLTTVPDTMCEVALAQVIYVPSEAIMSGSSNFLVRLPVKTTTDTWSDAALNIYEIDKTSNWTFEQNISYAWEVTETSPHYLNNMKINFTAGPHQLVYFSHYFDPLDESPSDGDDHYTRDDRTYVRCKFPMYSDTFYLFVLYVWFDADQYIEVYWNPDSISNGEWNRSTMAVYNEVAPDAYDLDQEDFNVSLGYTFDFIDGFGEGTTGLNRYYYEGDAINFWNYLDPATVDQSQYLTVMVPFRHTLSNVSIRTRVWAVDMGDTASALLIDDYHEWNDFVLVSDTDTIASGVSGLANFTGWFRISLTIENETRLRFSLWDLPYRNVTGYNASWLEETRIGWPFYDARWIHDNDWRWNPREYVECTSNESAGEIYHWQLFHALQVNDYHWDKSVAVSPTTNVYVWVPNYSFLEAVFYTLGVVYLYIGDVVSEWVPIGGFFYHALGATFMFLANWDGLDRFAGWVLNGFHKIWDGLKRFGEWILNIGQAVLGGLEMAAELLEVILAMIVFVLALALFFVPLYYTAKVGMIIRKIILGDPEGAIEDIGVLNAQTTGQLRKGARTLRGKVS